jgi:TonB family protein
VLRAWTIPLMKLRLPWLWALTCVPLPAVSLQGGKGAVVSESTDSLAKGGIEILTPTDGVDFSAYIKRLSSSVKKNWVALMPESARKGEKGKVIVRFRILANGTIPDKQLTLESASGSEPLRRAAIAAVKVSSPFEPCPREFKGPYVEMRYTFLYNLPLSEAKP